MNIVYIVIIMNSEQVISKLSKKSGHSINDIHEMISFGVISGGSLLAILDEESDINDIDLFTNILNKNMIIDFIEKFNDRISVNTSIYNNTISVIDIEFQDKNTIQLILYNYSNPDDIINTFDLDYVCSYLTKLNDGEIVLKVSDIAKRAIKNRTIYCYRYLSYNRCNKAYDKNYTFSYTLSHAIQNDTNTYMYNGNLRILDNNYPNNITDIFIIPTYLSLKNRLSLKEIKYKPILVFIIKFDKNNKINPNTIAALQEDGTYVFKTNIKDLPKNKNKFANSDINKSYEYEIIKSILDTKCENGCDVNPNYIIISKKLYEQYLKKYYVTSIILEKLFNGED